MEIEKAFRLLLILSLFICAIPLSGQNDHQTRQLDALFNSSLPNAPGAGILLIKNGDILYENYHGLANMEYQIPISRQTVFNANSLSKQFVAFAVYLLEKENKIGLEDPIQKYIPDFPEYANPIRIKHLLSHTSGLRDQWGLLSLSGWRFDDYISSAQLLQLIKQQRGLNFETNTQHGYSHSNYTLLATIIELVSDQPFADFMQERIFQPLNMDSTFYLTDSQQIVPNRAYSYASEDNQFQKVNLNYVNPGPTNLMSTTTDLAKWVANFENPIIGDTELLVRYNEIYTLADGTQAIAATVGDEYILGCKAQYFRDYNGIKFYSHGGVLGGFKAFIGRVPDAQFSIIMLANDAAFATYPTALSIIEICLREGTPKQDITASTPPQGKSKAPVHSVANPELIGSYYNQEVDSLLQVSLKNETLQLSIRGRSEIPLQPNPDGTFSAWINFNSRINFVRTAEAQIEGMEISSFGVDALYFERVK